MKNLFNKNYALISLYAFLVLAAAILFNISVSGLGAVFSFIGSFIRLLTPFIIGFAIAYLLNPSYMFFREKVFERFFSRTSFKKKNSLCKTLAMITVYVIAFGLLTFLLWIVIPQLYKSIATFVKDFVDNYETYTGAIDDFIGNVTNDSFNLKTLIDEGFKLITDYFSKFDYKQLTSIPVSVVSSLFSFFVGIIISFYMLFNKEKFCAQIKKTGYAIFKRQTMARLLRICGTGHNAFGKYITGVLIDALLVGTITTIFTSILGIEYPLLIGVIIGLTNMIPFFGPFIGGVPSVLIILTQDPFKALWMIVFLIVLQQLDGNFISPKIVGKKTGLSAIWVVFAILVGGGYFGVLGMLIAVPVFSIIYVLIRNMINNRLKQKRMSVDTADYYASADENKKFKRERVQVRKDAASPEDPNEKDQDTMQK